MNFLILKKQKKRGRLQNVQDSVYAPEALLGCNLLL